MEVEWITAAPINQMDIWIDPVLAVELICAARIKKEIGNPGHRYEIADWVLAYRHARRGETHGRITVAIHAAVAKAATAAR